MPVPSTADEFLDLTSRSGLVEPRQLRAYLQGRRDGALPDGARAMADVLVRDGSADALPRRAAPAGQVAQLRPQRQVQGCWTIWAPAAWARSFSASTRSCGGASPSRCSRKPPATPWPWSASAARPGPSPRLKHPNIVAAHDIDRDGKLHFLVMEYIDGNTLYTIVKRRGPLDVSAPPITSARPPSACSTPTRPGWSTATSSPPTWSSTGRARSRSSTWAWPDSSTTRPTTSAGGTPKAPSGPLDYMAPEQAMDSHVVDIRADIYGLGGTFYFLLAGRGPFGEGDAAAETMCHQLERPEPIRDVRPEVPEGLAAVIDRMMAKEPAERYPTPAAVAEALAPWTQSAIPPPPPEEMPELVAPPPGASDAAAPPALPAFLYESTAPPTPARDRRPATTPPRGRNEPQPHPGRGRATTCPDETRHRRPAEGGAGERRRWPLATVPWGVEASPRPGPVRGGRRPAPRGRCRRPCRSRVEPPGGAPGRPPYRLRNVRRPGATGGCRRLAADEAAGAGLLLPGGRGPNVVGAPHRLPGHGGDGGDRQPRQWAGQGAGRELRPVWSARGRRASP